MLKKLLDALCFCLGAGSIYLALHILMIPGAGFVCLLNKCGNKDKGYFLNESQITP